MDDCHGPNLTNDEMDVIIKLANAWSAFLKLPVVHNDDINEFRHFIHGAQNIVLSRPIFKQLNQREETGTGLCRS